MKWECGIPGKDGTLWAGAVFPLTMAFSEVLLHLRHLSIFTLLIAHLSSLFAFSPY